MDISKILDAVDNGLDFLKQIAPLASAFGLPITGVLSIVETITDIVDNIAIRAQEAGEVISSNDQARIAEITAALAKQNDELRAMINAS